MGNTEADEANGILKNTTIVVPLKYLSNFWRLLEMPLINYKIELKLRYTKYCVFSAAGADNTNDNPNNIISTIKDKKLYVLVVPLSAKDIKNYQNISAKDLKDQCIEMDTKTKSENKNTTNKYRYFSESNIFGVNRLFVLVYSNEDGNAKRFKTQRY